MGLIICNRETLIDAKNHIDTYNDQILTALEKIYTEFDDMGATINTPRSNKKLPLLADYYKEKVVFIKNSKERYNKLFDTIDYEYNDYLNAVQEMVGANND